jgi:hypothetical protein
MEADIVIRGLQPHERADWEPLWRAYLDFYRTSVPAQVYDTRWARQKDPNEPLSEKGDFGEGKL